MNKLSDVVPDDPDLVFVSDRHASIYSSIRKEHIRSKKPETTERNQRDDGTWDEAVAKSTKKHNSLFRTVIMFIITPITKKSRKPNLV